jgi:uncharacterized protein YidB (DUF937 family)
MSITGSVQGAAANSARKSRKSQLFTVAAAPGMLPTVAGPAPARLGAGSGRPLTRGFTMGMFDGLAGDLGALLNQGENADSASVVSQLLQGGDTGGMAGTLEALASNGLADQVASWTSDGQNLPVSPDQIRDALGGDQVKQMADASGLPVGDFLQHLAAHLPAAAAAS